MEFLCDYLRMMTLGTDNPHEMESLIDEELETHHHEAETVGGAVQTMADGLPALGIVAAVLASSRPWPRSRSRRKCWAD